MTFGFKRAKKKAKAALSDMASSPQMDDLATAVKRTLRLSLELADVAASTVPMPGVQIAFTALIKLIDTIEVSDSLKTAPISLPESFPIGDSRQRLGCRRPERGFGVGRSGNIGPTQRGGSDQESARFGRRCE